MNESRTCFLKHILYHLYGIGQIQCEDKKVKVIFFGSIELFNYLVLSKQTGTISLKRASKDWLQDSLVSSQILTCKT